LDDFLNGDDILLINRNCILLVIKIALLNQMIPIDRKRLDCNTRPEWLNFKWVLEPNQRDLLCIIFQRLILHKR